VRSGGDLEHQAGPSGTGVPSSGGELEHNADTDAPTQPLNRF
jgi:hypothetical protein